MANALVDFSNSLADAVEQAGRGVVGIKEGGQRGVSGTIWRPGVVVASEHTIRGHQQVTLVLSSGATATATVAGRDPGTDLAALRFDGDGSAASLADTAQVRVGHVVLAIGRRSEEGLATTFGVVSAVGGAWRTWHGGKVDRFFRLDLLPFRGFSGGPLIDVQGRVLGINTSGPRRTVLSIPSSTVDRVVSQLLERGRVPRGYLGAALQPVRLRGAAQEATGRDQHAGLLILTVAGSGPAEAAGLMIGDIIVGFNEHPVSDTSDLQEALDPEFVGKNINFQVLRGGRLESVAVTIGEKQRGE